MTKVPLGKSFQCAGAGIRHAVLSGRNVKIQSGIGACVAVAAVWCGLSAAEYALLVLTVAAVLAAELTNTAVEAVVDLASPEYHELAKTAKDVAAGAVLLMATASVVIGLLILGPPLWARLLGQ